MYSHGNAEYELAKRYILTYFADSLSISDSLDGFSECKLDPVEEDIVLQINKLHRVDEVWLSIKREYNISDTQEDAYVLFEKYINKLLEKGILVSGNQTRQIWGKKGKTYPLVVTVELTNKCNFECTHCYKEAGCQNDTFINTELAIQIFRDLHGSAWQVDITGGEALLHPDFDRIIEHADFPSLSLLTNGSLLHRVPMGTLKRFNDIQVSLYGASVEEYKKYARNSSFLKVCENIRYLLQNEIDVTVAIILRKTNYRELTKYIDMLDEMGVKTIRFGLTKKTGRNSLPSEEWDMSYEDCCFFDQQLQAFKKNYPHILFEDLNWRGDYMDDAKNEEPTSLRCAAGERTIVISERGVVRPCALLPTEHFGKLDWNEYIHFAEAGEVVCYNDCVEKCLIACKKEGRSINAICSYAFS